MLPFQTLITIQRNVAMPVFQQIANRLVGLIRDGIIRPGAALPGSREMAALLKVHRKTVVAAYQELFAQDWIETIPRKGVIVAQHLPDIKPRSFNAPLKIPAYAGNTGFAFRKMLAYPASPAAGKHRLVINDGFPDPRLAPVQLLLRECRSLFGTAAMKRQLLQSASMGALSLRNELGRFLSDTRGLQISPANILITHGAQMAIFIAARMILRPGDTVVTGEPSYSLADMLFEECGARLVKVPVDGQGMDVEALARICKKKKPALLYIIPHHHHPTTVTLSAERRMKLLELIRAYNLPIIEDDYDYDFHYDGSPILPLASADHGGNVIYIGSLTKSLVSTIRTGYLVAPENFINEAMVMRKMMDIRGDTLQEEALARLFRNGDILRHLKKSLKHYHERRNLLCNLLQQELNDAVFFRKPAGGMALWVQFSKKHPLPAIAAKASAKGLYMSDGGFYNGRTGNYNALRMGFASLNEQEIAEAVQILKQVT